MTDELNHEIDHRNPDNASRYMGHGGIVFDPVDFSSLEMLLSAAWDATDFQESES
jgi:hypothetical protein